MAILLNLGNSATKVPVRAACFANNERIMLSTSKHIKNFLSADRRLAKLPIILLITSIVVSG